FALENCLILFTILKFLLMKKLQTVFLVLILSMSTHVLSAQSYQQGFSLGQGDAQETMNMHFRKSRCLSSSSGPGSPIVYEECYVLTTSEQIFINFWQDYLANVKTSHCNAVPSQKEYFKGQVNGYHSQMLILSAQYSANYYGSNALLCPN
ncbi:hypothetical protein, partial [Fulvivirga sp.]|uniref:hypothetical protein n=2 Tax=Fulvivirga sp. TaxID=1931237 RepID=UPI0032EEDDD5